MGILSDNPFVGLGTKGTGYQINQSLRFNSADSTNLTRNISTTGNRRTFTISFWFKSVVSNSDGGFVATDGNILASNYIEFELNGSNKLQFRYSTGNARSTTAVFRDPSAWYHIVFAVDTTQATDTNRIRVYVNGIEYATTGDAYPAQNFDTNFNTAGVAAQIGHSRDNSGNPAKYLSGYIAEYNHIDGQQLTPSSFGETDTITGAWIPKKYSGSFGTNGFYLQFQSSGIGTDSSGNGNNWTANNFSTSGTGTDVMSDTPTNNYATINPLFTNYSGGMSDGNLVLGPWSDNGWNRCVGTISQNTGKWYFEVTADNSLASDTFYNGIGVAVDPAFINSANLWGSSGTATSYAGLLQSDEFYPFSNQTYGTPLTGSFSSGAVMQCAIDIDAGKLWFGVANSWIGGGNPASGTTPTYTITANAQYYFGAVTYGSGSKSVLNFGQRAFTYGPPRSDFKPLNTANLPEPTIKKGSKYMDVLTWSGTGGGSGATRSLTGLGFSPDFVWGKIRTSSSPGHILMDSVRGVGTGKYLQSNTTNAEGTSGPNEALYGYLSSLDSAGFTVTNGTSTFDNWNKSGDTYVAWAWDANGSGSSNTAGSITSTVSANATAGFSIVTYTGNATAGATVGHGLGVAPKMIICKRRQNNAAGTSNWQTYHASLGATKLLYLNTTTDALTGDSPWNNTAPTSTVFTLGDNPQGNPNGDNVVAYCFSEVAGYSKFGSYVSNNSADGPFIFCGFKPALVWLKKTSASSNWFMYDAARNTYNVVGNKLYADSSAAENGEDGGSTTSNTIDILSNGFKLRTNNGTNNGGDYIFCAWATHPFKYSNAR